MSIAGHVSNLLSPLPDSVYNNNIRVTATYTAQTPQCNRRCTCIRPQPAAVLSFDLLMQVSYRPRRGGGGVPRAQVIVGDRVRFGVGTGQCPGAVGPGRCGRSGALG